MSTRSIVSSVAVAVAAAVLGPGLGSGAWAQVPSPEVTVMVFADHYVLAGRAVDDLNVLERAVDTAGVRAVRLHACGEGTARAQQAAAHRFHGLYLELRVLDRDAPACRAAAVPRLVPATHRIHEKPTGIDDEAVDRWWHQLMP
jgi:hypothetical protein